MKKIEIKSGFDGKIIFSTEATSFKPVVEIAVRSGADLYGANLSRADLSRADLSRADLCGADLCGANLSRANLYGADLYGADLCEADLDVKIPPTNSHQFTSEILWRASKKERQKNFSARIRMETGLCWEDFYKIAKKMRVVGWAEKTLSKWDEYRIKIMAVKDNPHGNA